MIDWVKFIALGCLVVIFFWSIKVYYVSVSATWIQIKGEILDIYPASGGDAETFAITVKYKYDDTIFIKDVLDTGSLNIRDKSLVGQSVDLLVNPETPNKCVIKTESANLYDASAMRAAKIITRLLSHNR